MTKNLHKAGKTKNEIEYKKKDMDGGKQDYEKELQQESGNSAANLTPNVTHRELVNGSPTHAADPQNKINTQFSPR